MDKVSQPGAKWVFAQIMPGHERLPDAGMLTQTIFNQNQGNNPQLLQRACNGGANKLSLNRTADKCGNRNCIGQPQGFGFM